MTNKEITLGTVEAILKGKIGGFKKALKANESLTNVSEDIKDQMRRIITFTIVELEEVLEVIQDSNMIEQMEQEDFDKRDV
jgi:hypothetical protein